MVRLSACTNITLLVIFCLGLPVARQFLQAPMTTIQPCDRAGTATLRGLAPSVRSGCGGVVSQLPTNVVTSSGRGERAFEGGTSFIVFAMRTSIVLAGIVAAAFASAPSASAQRHSNGLIDLWMQGKPAFGVFVPNEAAPPPG